MQIEAMGTSSRGRYLRLPTVLLLVLLPCSDAQAITGGAKAVAAFNGFLGVWRESYKEVTDEVPLVDDAVLPAALQGVKPQVVIASGGAASGVVTEGMGYAIMVEGFEAAKGKQDALARGLSLTRSWLGMVFGPPRVNSAHNYEQPLGGGTGESGSATEVDSLPYGVSAIRGENGPSVASGMAAWKFPVSQCSPFCHGSATDGDEDAVLGMIYLAEAMKDPSDFVDVVMRAVISFASADLGFPDLYRTLSDGTKLFVPKGGSDWGGLSPPAGRFGSSQQSWCYNPSYFAPGHYRVFRDFAKKRWRPDFDAYLPTHLDGASSSLDELLQAFEGAVIAGYNILYYSSCSTGAVANWVGVKAPCASDDELHCDGVPWATTPFVGEHGKCTTSGTAWGSYGPDASRTPWRIAMDFQLYPEESQNVFMYSRTGQQDNSITFNAKVYLNRFANQYKAKSQCDGGKLGSCAQAGGGIATYKFAPAFDVDQVSCDNVPEKGQGWWPAFMCYPTFTAFVAPTDTMTVAASEQWLETFSSICDFSGAKPKGGICFTTYFELGQELIATMVMSGSVVPLAGVTGTGYVPIRRRAATPPASLWWKVTFCVLFALAAAAAAAAAFHFFRTPIHPYQDLPGTPLHTIKGKP